MSALLASLVIAGALVQNGSGHPLIRAYAGSEILGTEVREFDEQPLITGRPERSGPVTVERFQGKITKLDYQDPPNRSSLERFVNYEQALRQAGFVIVFKCGKDECGDQVGVPGLGYFPPERYLAARLNRPQGQVWVTVAVMAHPATRIYVVEAKPMETNMVAVDVAALSRDITATGHVAVYGILFDTGKADLKPESSATLQLIADLLKGAPSLKLHVVGHTDNVGLLAANMDLSARRANAVVTALTSRYGIVLARLRSSGVGPLAPVASNRTDEGKAMNRRVELVEQ
jgi:outer membrane protein OmpA-like peptidoglycan-associated protein